MKTTLHHSGSHMFSLVPSGPWLRVQRKTATDTTEVGIDRPHRAYVPCALFLYTCPVLAYQFLHPAFASSLYFTAKKTGGRNKILNGFFFILWKSKQT